jgi:hypothetical protein
MLRRERTEVQRLGDPPGATFSVIVVSGE